MASSSSSQVALVTGAGNHRVGWHVAQALAERGFAIAIHYRSSQAQADATVASLQGRGIAAAAFAANLSEEEEVRALVGDVLARFGRLDVLVHCAGTWNLKRLEEISSADVQAEFDANVLSTFLCCQHAGLAMARQNEGGSIVTVGDWAIDRPYLHHAAYLVSKGAIPSLTRVFAVELGTRNPRVRVNCILPGPVMLPQHLPVTERERVIRSTLLQREGRPENVSQAVLHFVGNDFITGACLHVDGGRSIFAGPAEAGIGE